MASSILYRRHSGSYLPSLRSWRLHTGADPHESSIAIERMDHVTRHDCFRVLELLVRLLQSRKEPMQSPSSFQPLQIVAPATEAYHHLEDGWEISCICNSTACLQPAFSKTEIGLTPNFSEQKPIAPSCVTRRTPPTKCIVACQVDLTCPTSFCPSTITAPRVQAVKRIPS